MCLLRIGCVDNILHLLHVSIEEQFRVLIDPIDFCLLRIHCRWNARDDISGLQWMAYCRVTLIRKNDTTVSNETEEQLIEPNVHEQRSIFSDRRERSSLWALFSARVVLQRNSLRLMTQKFRHGSQWSSHNRARRSFDSYERKLSCERE